MNHRIISIGTLSRNEHQKAAPACTPHATTTLIESDSQKILVDPGLPAEIITARLTERSGLVPADITDVFLTTFRPSHRAGLSAFADANWWISEAERERTGRALLAQFEDETDNAVRRILESEIALLQKTKAAPDKLAPHVDLFPLPGFTPGTCGLLLAYPHGTTIIAGDAIVSQEHLDRGQVLRGAFDIEQAKESLLEVIEIADTIIPGHDNELRTPRRR